MSIALIGLGRTGTEVARLLETDAEMTLGARFDSKHPADVESLRRCKVAIVFVPPTAAEGLVPELLDSGIDVVCGTTGYQWPQKLEQEVRSAGARWVLAHNFSLGMNLIRHCLNILGQSDELYGKADYHINETHHSGKLDAPSGTALSWQRWLDVDCDIQSTREGDVVGNHELLLETPFEQIRLAHSAKDRRVFAQGALWAAKALTRQEQLPPGVYDFSSLVDGQLTAPAGQTGVCNNV